MFVRKKCIGKFPVLGLGIAPLREIGKRGGLLNLLVFGRRKIMLAG
jgi:hypothetical protein